MSIKIFNKYYFLINTIISINKYNYIDEYGTIYGILKWMPIIAINA